MSAPGLVGAPVASRGREQENLGLLLGFVGVVIFAATLPSTRLAVPSLGPEFLTAARALIAGLLGGGFLFIARRPLPRAQLPRLALAAVCLTFGFPGFSSFAMRSLPASHAGVVIGVLPLATVVVATLIARERPSLSFWACAALGALLVCGFALHRGGGALQRGDALLLLAIASAALGYTLSGQLSREMPARDVISWMVVLMLPISAPLTFLYQPAAPLQVPLFAWACLAYLGAMSMYLGFFAWNAGLALGGVARVSQTQLAQPFITIGLSALLLGESVDAETIVCAVLVVALVFAGRRLRVAAAGERPARSRDPTNE
jgi:drug/metabolite transporter (DMT)-like permease